MDVIGAVAASLQLTECIWKAISTLRKLSTELRAAPTRIQERANYLDLLIEILGAVREATSLQTNATQKCIARVCSKSERIKETLLQDLERLGCQSHIIRKLFRTFIFLKHERSILELLVSLEHDKSNLTLSITLHKTQTQTQEKEASGQQIDMPGVFKPYKCSDNGELCNCGDDKICVVCPTHGSLVHQDKALKARHERMLQARSSEDGPSGNRRDDTAAKSGSTSADAKDPGAHHDHDQSGRQSQPSQMTPEHLEVVKTIASRVPTHEASTTPRSGDSNDSPYHSITDRNHAVGGYGDAHAGQVLLHDAGSSYQGSKSGSVNTSFSMYGKSHSGDTIQFSHRGQPSSG